MKTMTKKKESRREVLEKAFDGILIKDLAVLLGTSCGAIYNIKYGARQVSAIRAIQIENATKKMGHMIPRTVLRPDVFGE